MLLGYEFDRIMNGIGGEEVTARAEPARPLEWKFAQVFGERAFGEEVQEGAIFDFSICEGFIDLFADFDYN